VMDPGTALVWASVAALVEAGGLWLPSPQPEEPLCAWVERVAHATYTGADELALSLAAVQTLDRQCDDPHDTDRTPGTDLG
jgi:hypothetical protein